MEDPSDDRAAIRAVIRAETLAFQRRDFDAWAECFVHDDDTRDVLASSMAGLSVLDGWKAVAAHMRTAFRDGLVAKLAEFGQENMRITLAGDVAWAVFDSWSRTTDGQNMRSFDIRILRRTDGAWKIVFNAFIQREIEGASGLLLGADGTGRVIWQGPEGADALDRHPYLRLASGRLRARRTDWDRVLQPALAEAAGRHGFFPTHQFARETGGTAALPVILGRTGDGGVAVIHLLVRDCVTYVRQGDAADLDRRLDQARRVFGLSAGQTRVARGIASGQSLARLAAESGVSVTTARTHLIRIYEKTGVRSQTALVRLLLSIG